MKKTNRSKGGFLIKPLVSALTMALGVWRLLKNQHHLYLKLK